MAAPTVLTQNDPFVMTLPDDAEVNSAGEIVFSVRPATDAAERDLANVILPDALDNLGATATGIAVFEAIDAAAAASAIGATATGAAVLTAASATAARTAIGANTWSQSFHLPNIVSGTGQTTAITAEFTGTITRVDVVASNTIAAGDLVLTGSIGATPITNGVVTLTDGLAVRTVATAAPTAANSVVAGTSVVSFAASGGNTATGFATITIFGTRTA